VAYLRRVTRDEAAALLGVPADASPEDIRSAFRRLVRQRHPDITGPGGTAPTHDLIAAYRILQIVDATPPAETIPPRRRSPARPASSAPLRGVLLHDNTLHVPVEPGHAFEVLMEAAHGLGEVAYVDRSAGLLETIVAFDGYSVCSVLCTVDRRRRGWTDVAVEVESLTGGPAPPADAVAGLVAERLGGVLRSR
jgi:hypothetical protein